MKKREVRFRILRIITVILFLFIASSLRDITHESYVNANEIKSGIGTNLQVVQLNKSADKISGYPVTDEEGSKNDGYKIKVSNRSTIGKTFSFALIDNNISDEEKLPYKYIRYQVLKDGKIVLTDNINDNGYLYKETLKSGDECIYEIKFWIDIDADDKIMGKRFSSKIALI